MDKHTHAHKPKGRCDNYVSLTTSQLDNYVLLTASQLDNYVLLTASQLDNYVASGWLKYLSANKSLLSFFRAENVRRGKGEKCWLSSLTSFPMMF